MIRLLQIMTCKWQFVLLRCCIVWKLRLMSVSPMSALKKPTFYKKDFLHSLLSKCNVRNIWRYREWQQPLCMTIFSVTMKAKTPSWIKQASFGRGSSMEIRNVSLVLTELDSTIAFTGMFMGTTVHSLPFPALLQPYNFYLPVRFLARNILLKKIHLWLICLRL